MTAPVTGFTLVPPFEGAPVIATVSQSEGGFELVHQSVVVQPHWILQADAQGAWSVTIRLTADTSVAEERAREAKGEMASV